VKESVFGILSPVIEDRRVLDLFAGTGNLGIEALSRGAESAVFVEKSGGAAGVVKANLAAAGLECEATVVVMDAFRALGALAREGRGPFSLVFLDPPYGQGLAAKALEELAVWPALADDAVAVVEHANHDQLAETYGALVRVRSERYGETVVSFYRIQKQQTEVD
jgi:16S rRNA (guanine(966)-N(2))-methyltransferase RsmD